MDVKDVRKVFRDADLNGKDQVDAFVAAVSPLPAPELVKLLATLTD